MDEIPIHELEINAEWTTFPKADTPCKLCGNYLSPHYIRVDSNKAVCLHCLQQEIENRVRQELHQSWRIKIKELFHKIMDERASSIGLVIHLSVLQGLFHGYRYFSDSSRYTNIIPRVVSLMGYDDGSPLAQGVRSKAFNVAVYMGSEIVPLCKENFGSSVWQLYANSLLAAGIVDPLDREIQEELEKAWHSENGRIFAFIQNHLVRKGFGIYHSHIEPDVLEALKASAVEITSVAEGEKFKADISVHRELFYSLYKGSQLSRLKVLYDNWIGKVVRLPVQKKKSSKAKRLKKSDYAAAMVGVFSRKELFNRFFTLLPKDVQQLFSELIWRNVHFEVTAWEKRTGRSILLDKARHAWYFSGKEEVVISDYSIFEITSADPGYGYRKYYFQLNTILRNMVKPFFPDPEWSKLRYLKDDDLRREEFFCDEGKILTTLPIILQYMEVNPVSRTSTGKLSAKYRKDIHDKCGVEELFDPRGVILKSTDKHLRLLRTEMVIELLDYFGTHPILQEYRSGRKKKKREEKEVNLAKLVAESKTPADGLKKAYQTLMHSGKLPAFIISRLLTYLKFNPYDFFDFYDQVKVPLSRNFKKSISEIMKTLSNGEWLGIENLFLSLEYEEKISYVFPLDFSSDGFYFNETHVDEYDRIERIHINSPIYIETLFKPFIRACFYLFAALGYVDLAHHLPSNRSFHHAKREYLSVYDGLKAVRLNPFGLYVFGFSDKLPAGYTAGEEPFSIELDHDFLIVRIKGTNRVKEFIISDMAEKIRPGLYSLTYDSFLNNCRTESEVKKRIALFRKEIEDNPPKNFELFFSQLLSRFNPMEEVSGYVMFKIKDDPLLISLLHDDPFLRKNVLKAEGYHILVKSRALKGVKQHLGKAGFFVS